MSSLGTVRLHKIGDDGQPVSKEVASWEDYNRVRFEDGIGSSREEWHLTEQQAWRAYGLRSILTTATLLVERRGGFEGR